jgi:protein phosphatase
MRVYAMRTDAGRVRHTNQDACAALPELGAFVVCDGVGGTAGGEIASHLAAEVFLNSLGQAFRTPKSCVETDHPHSRLQRAIHSANHAVFQRGQKSKSMRGMGTTLVAALFVDEPAGTNGCSHSRSKLWLAHVGDSRCYVLRNGSLQLLTQDHSLVEEQVRAGLITSLQAATSPIRNIITRAIGTQPAVEPDIYAHPIQSGDLVLLASDGLTRELSEETIAQILQCHDPCDPDTACKALIDAANRNGGRDNITVLLVTCN